MFHHIVLLQFTADSTDDAHRAIVDALKALPALIDEIIDYEVNIDAGLDETNAHVSVHATFVDEAAWRAYSSHPEHLKVLNGKIKPILKHAARTQFND